MELDEAKKVLSECTGITKIELAFGIDQTHGLQAHAMNRLAKLKAELPKALAQRAMEKENNVKGIKIEIAEHEETLADAPLTLQELTRLQAANAKQIKEARTVIEKHEYRQKYDALKDEIRASSYSEAGIDSKLSELKGIANSIDHYGGIQHDFEEFVIEMQDKYKGYRILG